MDSNDGNPGLIDRVAKGDSEAIAELYTSYVDSIYRSVFNQVDGNQQVAQDIVQDIFVVAIESAKSYQGRSAVYTWLYSIAHKKVADYYRKKKLDRKYFGQYQRDSEQILETLIDPVDLESASLVKTYLQQLLQRMPLHYRQVLLLKYIDKMPVVEIAVIMGKSVKSIEGILSRAREELKMSLSEMEDARKPV
ncbi:MAG: RNA polymerase sigma factor [Dehalococcoidaceae bacterium]|nr:RNA polymerase sigma factor [Dehalococcoidaceae bacterium]